PQPARSAGQARPGAVGVRLLGLVATAAAGGERAVPASLRDRDELSADEPGAGADVHAQPGGAAVPGGGGVAAAQRVGVAALGGAGGEASGRTATAAGGVDAQGVAADAAAGGGRTLRLCRRTPDGTATPRQT